MDILWRKSTSSKLQTNHFFFTGNQREKEYNEVVVRNIIHAEDSAVALSPNYRLLVSEGKCCIILYSIVAIQAFGKKLRKAFS